MKYSYRQDEDDIPKVIGRVVMTTCSQCGNDRIVVEECCLCGRILCHSCGPMTRFDISLKIGKDTEYVNAFFICESHEEEPISKITDAAKLRLREKLERMGSALAR